LPKTHVRAIIQRKARNESRSASLCRPPNRIVSPWSYWRITRHASYSGSLKGWCLQNIQNVEKLVSKSTKANGVNVLTAQRAGQDEVNRIDSNINSAN
jgi:hypothetical protein